MNVTLEATANTETFAHYLAQQLIEKKGYRLVTVPETLDLIPVCDMVLTKADGMVFQTVCIVDRQRDASKRFALSSDAVRAIGEACEKYSGTINNRKIPVTIQIIEIGHGINRAAERSRMKQYKASFRRNKMILNAWLIDIGKNSVWTNASFPVRLTEKSFIKRLLRQRGESKPMRTAKTARAFAETTQPILTFAILALLIGVFAVELKYGVEPFTGLLEPSIKTIVALGGLNRTLVLDSGEWYRLSTSVFLHLNVAHLIMNGVALLLVGYVLENLIGRVWFAAVFAVSAVCGAAMSLAVNSANIVFVGASGAILGLFTATFVCCYRLPAGTRAPLQMRLLQVLIPSLIPITAIQTGHPVDFSAHFGGVLGGGAMGLLLLIIWDATALYPPHRPVALVIATLGFSACAITVIPVIRNYPIYALSARLMPPEVVPNSNADAIRRSTELAARYPDDPRTHLYRALALMDGKNAKGAESELREALSEDDMLRTQFKPEQKLRLTTMLAIVLSSEGRNAEALRMAAPMCADASNGQIRTILIERRLCNRM